METCRHGRMRQITECQDCELNEAEAEILVLRAELEQTRDTVLDLFCQACTVKDESGATKYDHKLRAELDDCRKTSIERRDELMIAESINKSLKGSIKMLEILAAERAEEFRTEVAELKAELNAIKDTWIEDKKIGG